MQRPWLSRPVVTVAVAGYAVTAPSDRSRPAASALDPSPSRRLPRAPRIRRCSPDSPAAPPSRRRRAWRVALAGAARDPGLGADLDRRGHRRRAPARVLWSRGAAEPEPPASTTKLLTAAAALLVLGPQTRLDDHRGPVAAPPSTSSAAATRRWSRRDARSAHRLPAAGDRWRRSPAGPRSARHGVEAGPARIDATAWTGPTLAPRLAAELRHRGRHHPAERAGARRGPGRPRSDEFAARTDDSGGAGRRRRSRPAARTTGSGCGAGDDGGVRAVGATQLGSRRVARRSAAGAAHADHQRRRPRRGAGSRRRPATTISPRLRRRGGGASRPRSSVARRARRRGLAARHQRPVPPRPGAARRRWSRCCAPPFAGPPEPALP